MSFDPDYPIILGLAGEALTGKTITAKTIAPTGRIVTDPPDPVWFEHLYFAMPLYEIASIRQKTEGDLKVDRELYGVLEVLLEVFGTTPLYGAPAFDELISMVYDIVDYPIPPEGEKPRSFLQWLGTDVCRAKDPNCWVNWMKRRVQKEYAFWKQEHAPKLPTSYTLADVDNGDKDSDRIDKWEMGVDRQAFGVVISDVRFPNEVEYIRNQRNGLVVKFTCDEDIRRDRMIARDGYLMDKSQQSHASERGLDTIPNDHFYAILDTSEIKVDEQVAAVASIVDRFMHA